MQTGQKKTITLQIFCEAPEVYNIELVVDRRPLLTLAASKKTIAKMNIVQRITEVLQNTLDETV